MARPAPSSLILAVDLGTSGAKAAVVDVEGRILGTGHARVETITLPGGGAEQDPAQVLDAVSRAARQATDAVDDARKREFLGVAVTSQYSSVIPVDQAQQPVMNMVLWMDQRSSQDAMAGHPRARAMRPGPVQMLRYLRAHGIPPLPSGIDTLSHMRWIKLARPQVYARTATFLEPADFLTTWMTGRATTNPCSAFMMLVVDNRRLTTPRYHPGLLALSGIERDKFPELLPIDADVGTLRAEVAGRLGVPAGIRVFGACNDTQAGGAATSSLTGSHAGISVGTTSVMVTHVPFKKTDIRNSLATMPSPVPGSYSIVAENGIGGRAVEHFLDKIVFANDGYADHSLEAKFEALHRAIAHVEPGSGGALFLPWLKGSVSPVEDGRVRGGFLNMSLETTREHLGRAVLEGIALNFRWLRGAVEGFVARRLSHIVFYGGGALSDPWCQIFADVLGLPIHQVAEPRYAICRGVALLGFHRAGRFNLDALEQRVPIARIHAPRRAHAATYDRLYSQFVRAFHRNRAIFRALNHPPNHSEDQT